jgi:hypothetical protein
VIPGCFVQGLVTLRHKNFSTSCRLRDTVRSGRNAYTMNKVLLAVGLIVIIAVVVFGTKFKNEPHTQASVVSPSPAPVPATDLSNQNEWVIRTQTSHIDDTVTTFVDSDGGTIIGGFHLCFQSKGKCNVQVSYDMPRGCFVESNLDGEYTSWERRVRYKFDDDPPHTQVWSIADSRNAIIPPNEKTFIEEMKRHKKIIIEAGCASYDSGELTANLVGLQDTLNNAHLQ